MSFVPFVKRLLLEGGPSEKKCVPRCGLFAARGGAGAVGGAALGGGCSGPGEARGSRRRCLSGRCRWP
eukprot:4272006-Alexandrium_andersonii.AAC.1